MEPEVKKSPFWSTNTFLLIVLITLVALIIFEAYSFFINKTIPQTTPVFESGKVSKNLNINNFQEMKKNITPDPNIPSNVIESRFTGVIASTSNLSAGFEIRLIGKVKPFEGKTVTYTYPKNMLSKITVWKLIGTTEEPIAISELKKGDEVYIDEKNDLSKTYAEGIVAVKITKTN
ncbi:hypothetical protein A3H83_04100 [Candidatus Roizmanbacteria bacterium RIFCSPLOWO2_02_FULL_39_8]|nr:MAG: hypothetical protein A3H83_04100 [Candidatus Roizmanbacteria bacterium RIFCSPLOWO2_02_FULL_39_8]